ncbi:MAG: ABC transporter substrate-binding protein, partial [Oscillospiraceae bacterium]
MKKLLAVMMSVIMLMGCGKPTQEAKPQAVEEKSSTSESKIEIGVLKLMEHPSLDEIYNSFADEIKVLGYEDKIDLELQSGQNDMSMINTIAKKFVGDKKTLIVAIATPAAQGVAAATSEIPILFSAVTDPVAAGLTDSLEKPDRNLTGTSDRIPTDKILELALELTPNIKTMGLIYNTAEVNSVTVITEMKKLLEEKGIKIKETPVNTTGEVATAAQTLVSNVDAIFSPIDNTVALGMPVLSKIATENKIPVYVSADSMVHDGGLATVGVNYENLGRQTARMAVRILEGAKISDT